MKCYSVFIISLLFFINASFSQKMSINYEDINKTVFNLTENKFSAMSFEVNIKSISGFDINFSRGNFTLISSQGMINDGDIGSPALPVVKKLIEIPWDALPEVQIISYDEEIIDLNEYGLSLPIFPKQPSLSKSENPDEVPFFLNSEAYSINSFGENPIAEVEIMGIMRGVRIGRLTVRPYSYNPVKNQLKLYHNIEAVIIFKGANKLKTQEQKSKFHSPLFSKNYNNLINYNNPNQTKDSLTKYPIKYLIVSDRMFEAQLQPFIEWKTRKGFFVEIGYTDDIGNTTSEIKNYIANIYNNGTPSNPAPTYLLLVGDVEQIPAFAGTTGSHVSDLYYCEMDGNGDYFPEMYFGRFSAQTHEQLQPQIDKTLQFEQYTMPNPAYLEEVLMVAGVDNAMAPTYGNGQIYYATSTYFNASNGVSSHTYYFGSGSPITSNDPAASAAIRENVSKGVGFGNYTAHCNSNGWSSPDFLVSHIPELMNEDMYCFLVGNCCQSNKFEISECFGEAIVRAENKGAVAYIGGSNNTYWDEDYYYSVGVAQISATPDYANSGLGYYDKLFHQNGEDYSDWYVTGGQINFGGNLAVTEGGTRVKYYWEIYHIMGDPSLMPYIGIPDVLYANYMQTIPIGIQSLNIQTEEYAYVALSYNNVLQQAVYSGNSTTVDLDLSFVNAPCTLDIVITKQNRQPHIEQIYIIPNNSAYVIHFGNQLKDLSGNNNGKADYNEEVLLDITLKNVGNFDATNVSAILSTLDTNVTIIADSSFFGNIDANLSETVFEGYSFIVDTLISNLHAVQFALTATDGTDIWTSNFNITLYAPNFTVPTYNINDELYGNNNMRLDPGETAFLTVSTLNNGNSLSPNATSNLSTASQYISIGQPTMNLGNINENQSIDAIFEINVDASTPIGTVVNFIFEVEASGYTASKLITLPVGLIVEDWESGSFDEYPWNNANFGDLPWFTTSQGTMFEGNYAARSGIITDNQKSELNISVNVLNEDTLSFYKRVSSEKGSNFFGTYYWYDYLEFFINGTSMGKWDGIINWSREAFNVSPGVKNLKWVYSKDNSVAEGEDLAMIDFIVFPAVDFLSDIKNNTSISHSLSAYPNPFNNVVNFNIGLAVRDQVSLVIYNCLGQAVETIIINQPLTEGLHTFSINLNNHPAGLYFAKMTSSAGQMHVQIVQTK